MKEVLDDLEKNFKKQHADKPPSQEAIKQYNDERERVKEVAKANPDDVIGQVGEQLNTFFDSLDKIEALFWEEERAAKKVYTGQDSVGRRALQRVLIRTRLQKMHVEMREAMVYQAPAELGDLWTRFEKMREQIEAEQEEARAEQRRKDAQNAWQRELRIKELQDKAWDVLLVLLVVLYVWSLMWEITKSKASLAAFLSALH